MKFNKSAESDFWYVQCNNSCFAGKINFNSDLGYTFQHSSNLIITAHEMIDIANFMLELEKQSGIDTTSTFKSKSELI